VTVRATGIGHTPPYLATRHFTAGAPRTC
jgi:hypothetical protein